MTTAKYKELEANSFIGWRKAIAELEEKNLHLAMSVYEKNISIWRQLWLVIERSDIVCQIVDARNPEFFMCSDLIAYVNELNKKYFLIINKADFLN